MSSAVSPASSQQSHGAIHEGVEGDATAMPITELQQDYNQLSERLRVQQTP